MNNENYEEIEHTADWAYKIKSQDLPGLFEIAVRSMLHMAGAQPSEEDHQIREISIDAPDLASLLVEWLQEWIYLLETEDRIPIEFLKISILNTKIKATVMEAPLRSLTKQIKAVTYHGLQLNEADEGFTATVVFDV